LILSLWQFSIFKQQFHIYLQNNQKPMINDHSNSRMATDLPTRTTNGEAISQNASGELNFTVKTGLARMLKGGVIMDVVNAEQVLNCPSKLASREEMLTHATTGQNS
jgi:hypothetical protein